MLNQFDTDLPKRKPLSTGQVIGFAILIFTLFTFIQVLVLIGLSVIQSLKGTSLSIEAIAGSGFYIALATILGGVVGTTLIILIVRYFQGRSCAEYLGLTRISLKQLGFWILSGAIYLVLMDICTYLLRRPIVPEFMNKVIVTAKFPWLLYFAFIIAAPVFEELFFRGFLYKGLCHSRLKPIGAIILTSLCWSFLHMQYDWYGVLQIFLGGLLFGYARYKSGSVYVPVAMHALQNLVATIEATVIAS
ncbi:MAG: CPBP family intramembrane metalloprotease [Firmicutes bacterium]|nr:CPBP family intramembrane metalloprotease [Bacillota bacterium]